MYGLLGYAVGAAVTVAIRRQLIPKPRFTRWSHACEHGIGATWFGTSVEIWRPRPARRDAR